MTMLALTMGEPAGVGPEIVLKAFAARQERSPRWLWVGEGELLTWTGRQLGLPAPVVTVASAEEAATLDPGVLPVLPLAVPCPLDALRPGHPRPETAAAVVASIETACRLAMAGRVAGVVTPPIHKGALHQAGFAVPGHTELFARCAGVGHPVMMLTGRGLRVIPATIHQSLRSVPDALNEEFLRELLVITHAALVRDFALPHPRIAVAGLNPHAGEGGSFGHEEEEVIAPVVRALVAERGWLLRGPLPADTLFHPAARKNHDAVVCMYHDQALIPLKMLAFGQAVNVTLGLPLVRTSVDHGTALDIAGQGRADHRSLLAAIELAARIARHRAAWNRT